MVETAAGMAAEVLEAAAGKAAAEVEEAAENMIPINSSLEAATF